MKECCILFFLIPLAFSSAAQKPDSIPTNSSDTSSSTLQSVKPTWSSSGFSLRTDKPQSWRIIRTGDVLFKAFDVPLPSIQRQILELESSECLALRKQDQATLIRIWSRDFTLDKKNNQIVSDNQGLPVYGYLERMINLITPLDDSTVLTTGFEMYSQFDEFHSQPVSKREFNHTWQKKNGVWKLVNKRLGAATVD